jgi:AcrR family transcriptional regulator
VIATPNPVPSTTRTRLPRDQRREQLLDVAEGLFADGGFENTSMEDIARAAGVTRPVVYAHFPTKEAAFVACVRRARAELETKLGALGEVPSTDVTLEDIIKQGGEIFFEILERDPSRWSVLFSPSSALSTDVAQQLTALRFGTVERIAEIVNAFIPGMDDQLVVHAYAHAVSGVGEQLGRWWLANPDVPRARVVGLYRDFIMRGLGPWDDVVTP